MDTVWPWLALAGAGALHGLNPATGWALAAAWSVRRGPGRATGRAVLQALWPLALGHGASIALLALAIARGVALDGRAPRTAALVLLAATVALHLGRRVPARLRAPAGQLGLALWSFVMAGLHGAGLVLVPTLLPLCVGVASPPGGAPALGPALAGVAVHMAAMLAVTAVMAMLGGGRRAAPDGTAAEECVPPSFRALGPPWPGHSPLVTFVTISAPAPAPLALQPDCTFVFLSRFNAFQAGAARRSSAR